MLRKRIVWRIPLILATAVIIAGGRLSYHCVRVNDIQMAFVPIGDWRIASEPIEVEVCSSGGGCQAITLGGRVAAGPLTLSWLNQLGRGWRDWQATGR